MTKIVLIVGVVLALMIAVSNADATVTTIPHRCKVANAPVLCAIHFHYKRTKRIRAKLARQTHYFYVAERHPNRRLRVLSSWVSEQQHAQNELEYMEGTPSRSACYAFIERKFANLDESIAYAIVKRESKCDAHAQNSTSTAAGVFQFLNHWGTLSQRLNLIWSANRAYRYRASTGSWSPWAPVPSP